jgi:hypothetical protein
MKPLSAILIALSAVAFLLWPALWTCVAFALSVGLHIAYRVWAER